jgi:hypothetical protein
LEVYVVWTVLGDCVDDFASLAGIHEVEGGVVDSHYTVERVEFAEGF